MLRQAESRLNRDKEAMLAEQRNQNLLLTNLKTIQVPNHTTMFFFSDDPLKNLILGLFYLFYRIGKIAAVM